MPWSIKTTKALNEGQYKALLELWNKEYPSLIQMNNLSDLKEYIANLKDCKHELILDSDNQLVAWSCSFEREELPWFAMIIDRAQHGRGLGSQILDRLKQQHSILNGWAVDVDHLQRADGSQYPSPLEFYRKNKFRISKRRPEESPLSIVHIFWP